MLTELLFGNTLLLLTGYNKDGENIRRDGHLHQQVPVFFQECRRRIRLRQLLQGETDGGRFIGRHCTGFKMIQVQPHDIYYLSSCNTTLKALPTKVSALGSVITCMYIFPSSGLESL